MPSLACLRTSGLFSSSMTRTPKSKFLASLLLAALSEILGAEAPALRPAQGFKIEVWADNIPNARSLSLSPEGWLFVGTRSDDKVYAIDTRTPPPRKTMLVADGLKSPNGVAFKDDVLYVAEIHRVIAFDAVVSKLSAAGGTPKKLSYRVVSQSYPSDEHHGWKFVRFGPDGNLYVPIGAPCNVCARKDPYATLTRLDLKSGNFEIVARGIRNTVGFDWDREGRLWFTDNGRDHMGDNTPPCEINMIEKSTSEKVPDFGFPACHGQNIQDPAFGTPEGCLTTRPPVVELGAHTAPLGLRVIEGRSWPARYRGGLVFAEHGSWNRSSKVGYRVAFVPLKGATAGKAEDLVTGFLDGQRTRGRPVDVEELPDGSLLISDDHGNRIWRLSREGARP